MTIDKADIEIIVKRAERLATRELKRHEKRERTTTEDVDANRKAMRKRRQRWKQKFTTIALLISAGSVSALALFGTAGNKDIRTPGPLVKIERPLQEEMQIDIYSANGNTAGVAADLAQSPVSRPAPIAQIRLIPLQLVDGSYGARTRETELQLQTMLEEIEAEQQSRLLAPVI